MEPITTSSLIELPYHIKVKNHFKQREKVWDFFKNATTKEDQLKRFKTDLLKNTYKFDPASERDMYDKVDLVKEKLQLQHIDVLVYQSQFVEELNASVICLGNEAHIVFSGHILKLLTDDELISVLAHELSHIKLYNLAQGDYEITDRIITAIANNLNSEPSYVETARLFKLYTELFCDRGSYIVLGKLEPVISSLVKISTSLETIQVESYLKQVDEIFASKTTGKSLPTTHPENFIRAKAIQLWMQQDSDLESKITTMIESDLDLDQLDIFDQFQLVEFTETFLQLILKPKWFQTTIALGQARQFNSKFAINEKAMLQKEWLEKIEKYPENIKDYLSYLMYDFANIDPGLEEVPMGWLIQLSEDVHLKINFENILRKELQLSDKKLQQFKEKMLNAYYEVKEGENEQIYE